MAKKVNTFDDDGMRRIGKVVRHVENSFGNDKEGKQESHPNRRHHFFARTHSVIPYLSTGVTCSILGGHPSSALSTGYGTVQVFGSILGATTVEFSMGATVVIEFISGYWQATAEVCT